MKKFIENFEVPSDLMMPIAALICENELVHHIDEVDEDADTITLIIEFMQEERGIIHEIEDLIADHDDEDEDYEDEDDE